MTTVSGQTQPDGIRVGSYRLIARIGEGGMGVVHLAQAPDGSRVALKVLRPHVIGDAESRERLAREVSSLRLVSSPRVAEVIDADPHGTTPYVATRYVPGLSLHEHVHEEGPVRGADLIHLADALAEALAAVHAVGVLHRDVKPSNVLMEGRSPVLIDFGLARLAEDPRLTHTGWLLGTPGYLAPEILYGDDATPASDVHAWAATVAYAAVGRPPYGKGPAMAIMDRVRRGEHDLSAVPQPLVDLLAACLAPDPLDRPSIHEIRAWLGSRRGPASRGSVGGPPPEQWTMPVAASHREPPTEVRPTSAEPHPTPTRTLPAVPPDPGSPALAVPAGSRAQRRGQLLGLTAVVTSAVAFAPYAATVLVGVVVLLLRTTSVTRERHIRRRLVRGRARWYDVPATTLATPGYLVLGLLGALVLVAWAAGAAIAAGVVAALFGPPLPVGMLVAGLGFTLALWWGPMAGRVRDETVAFAARWSRSDWAGLFVIAASVLGAVVLVGALSGAGPTWSPLSGAPWASGILAEVASHL